MLLSQRVGHNLSREMLVVTMPPGHSTPDSWLFETSTGTRLPPQFPPHLERYQGGDRPCELLGC